MIIVVYTRQVGISPTHSRLAFLLIIGCVFSARQKLRNRVRVPQHDSLIESECDLFGFVQDVIRGTQFFVRPVNSSVPSFQQNLFRATLGLYLKVIIV